MIKFENIKAGDELLIKKRIQVGWNISKEFTIPIKVDKTTKTQIVVEGGRRFKKENGVEIKGNSWGQAIFYPGDKESWYSKKGAYDQTHEMVEFIKTINILLENKKIIASLSLTEDNPHLTEINKLLKNVKALCDYREAKSE